MPELGKYAWTVLSAYGLSILLLILLVFWSYLCWRSVKSDLDAQESPKDV
ncbi:MAG: heme exporter protein CcmD [Paracoccaceae bacterium]|nr:heme exporter protein CcmD [Paracoccaceae bacterium]